MKIMFKILFFFLIMISCNKDNNQVLIKLSKTEIMERAKKDQLFSKKNIIYKNENNEIINKLDFDKLSVKNEWTFDRYVNAENKDSIVIIKLRKATKSDLVFEKGLTEYLKRKEPIKILEIDCNKLSVYLDEAFELDQKMRINGNIDPKIDRKNTAIIVSIIEKCGMPTLNEVNQKQLNTIWLVLQHTENKIRKKYFNILKIASKNGDISKAKIAMMQDRILTNEGKPQIYGTQIKFDNKSGKYKLYKIASPEKVNKLRKEVGLEPIEKYLKNWNIIFNEEQIDNK